MKELFYLFGCFFILFELIMLVTCKDFLPFLDKIEREKKERKESPDLEPEHLLIIGFAFLVLMEFAWELCGLLSSQWIIFLILIILSYTLTLIRKILSTDGKILVFKINRILAISTFLFLILNAFHFHANTSKIFFNLFF